MLCKSFTRNTVLLSLVPLLLFTACGKDKEDEQSSSKSKDGNDPLSGLNVDKMGNYCTDLQNAALNPLGKYQWHLQNTGNEAFATPYSFGVDETTAQQKKSSAVGQDINVAKVLKDYCLSGQGVYVAVVDTGIEMLHPSLRANVDSRPDESETWSRNFRTGGDRFDPSPLPEDGPDHGTMVSGIIAMRSNLGFGGSGVAPRAQLNGYNIINNDTQTFSNFYESLGGSLSSYKNAIFSMSYGMNNLGQVSTDEPTELASISMYETGVRSLRNGLGAIYVKAAGNGFGSMGWASASACRSANQFGLSCQNSSMNPDNTMTEVITVGALNSFGKKTSYSTTGSSLWISAPGGEFSFDKAWIEEKYKNLGKAPPLWSNYRSTIGEPAIVTTDVSGRQQGLARAINLNNVSEIFDIRNKFNAGLVPENDKFHYTNSMNGTSSATPVTSGSIALILEANPNLTWRDVKYILAQTATKVDPDFQGVSVQLKNSAGTMETVLLDQGWIENAAGYHFSNWYGFGRVNVEEAVKLARNFVSPLKKFRKGPWIPEYNAASIALVPGDFSGLVQSIPVSFAQNVTIESVRVRVSIDSTYVGDVALELTSPSGTKSLIWHAGNGFANNGNLVDFPIQTNAFYGENSRGTWELKVVHTGLHNSTATFKGWQLMIDGYK